MEIVKAARLGFSEERLGRIGQVMQGYVDKQQIAGIVTLVARRGEVAQFEAYGAMGLDPARPMRRDALFRLFSMTKPITCAAAMMLFEAGQFRLNDPISRYIPAFKDMRVATPRTAVDFDLVPARREITIHDLFTHTSGLSYGFDPHSFIDDLYRRKLEGVEDDVTTWTPQQAARNMLGLPQDLPPLEEFVNRLAQLPLASQPGTTFRYSYGIDVLGRLIEVISGQPLDVFMKERIFDPLGMCDTDFWAPPEKIERFTTVCGPESFAAPRLIVMDDPASSPFARPARYFSGGGGLVSTAEDYFRFCQMLLNGGELDGTRLLGRKTVELMFSNHLAPQVPFQDPAFGFGLGGSVQLDPAQAHWLGSAGRWSWGGAANTEFWIDPREELIAVLMLQYMPSDMLPIQFDFNNLVNAALVG